MIHKLIRLRKQPPFVILQTLINRTSLRLLFVHKFRLLAFDGVPLVKNPRGPGEIREGGVSDVPEMERLENKGDLFLKRFGAGDRCIIALVQGKIVGYEWFTEKAFHMEDRYLYRILVPPDSIYAYDAYILPAYRMHGIWVRFKKYMAEAMEESGRRRIIVLIDYDNSLSINTHSRFGFVPFREVLVMRVLGKFLFKETTGGPFSQSVR